MEMKIKHDLTSYGKTRQLEAESRLN